MTVGLLLLPAVGWLAVLVGRRSHQSFRQGDLTLGWSLAVLTEVLLVAFVTLGALVFQRVPQPNSNAYIPLESKTFSRFMLAVFAPLPLLPVGWLVHVVWRRSRRKIQEASLGEGWIFAGLAAVLSVGFLVLAAFAVMTVSFALFYNQ
jgi:hypothetical protein